MEFVFLVVGREGRSKRGSIYWIMAQAEDIAWTDVFLENSYTQCQNRVITPLPWSLLGLTRSVQKIPTSLANTGKWGPYCSYLPSPRKTSGNWTCPCLACSFLIEEYPSWLIVHVPFIYFGRWALVHEMPLILSSQRGEFSIRHHCLGLCVTECMTIWG